MEDWKAQYIFSQISRTKFTAKHEIVIIPNLVYSERLIDLKPEIQKYVPGLEIGKKYVDLYYSQLKLAIEIDEDHHNRQQEDDKVRQDYISKELDCTFERFSCDEKSNHKKIAESIIDKIEETWKERGLIFEWKKPNLASINWAQEDLDNAVFFPGKYDDENGFYYPYRRVSEDKRDMAEIAFCVSASTMDNTKVYYPSNIFKIEGWREDPNNNGYYAPYGTEMPHDKYRLSAYTDWPQGPDVLWSENIKNIPTRKYRRNIKKK